MEWVQPGRRDGEERAHYGAEKQRSHKFKVSPLLPQRSSLPLLPRITIPVPPPQRGSLCRFHLPEESPIPHPSFINQISCNLPLISSSQLYGFNTPRCSRRTKGGSFCSIFPCSMEGACCGHPRDVVRLSFRWRVSGEFPGVFLSPT